MPAPGGWPAAAPLADGLEAGVGAGQLLGPQQVLEQPRHSPAEQGEGDAVAGGHGVQDPQLGTGVDQQQGQHPDPGGGVVAISSRRRLTRSTSCPARGANSIGSPRAKNTAPTAALLPVRSLAQIASDRYRALSPSWTGPGRPATAGTGGHPAPTPLSPSRPAGDRAGGSRRPAAAPAGRRSAGWPGPPPAPGAGPRARPRPGSAGL